MVLAGNFGELRSNHFHSGIDIKTQGKTGIPVYSAAEGTVSRLKISPFGYGLALYIDHPNGYTTVYGHLDHLRDDLAEYARNIQYDEKSFAIDVAVPKGKFNFKKGELIAYTGNSGSSGGPHLHFEIRDTKSEHPLNPLLFNFDIKDTRSPKLISVMLYPLSEGANINGKAEQMPFDLVYYDGAYHLKGNPKISAGGEIGFGIMGLDYLDGSWSKCGIYEINLSVNERLIFSFKMNELSFSESRYINSYIDYTYRYDTGRRYQKNWIEPGNQLSNYPIAENRGKIKIEPGQDYELSYLVRDADGNNSRLKFKLNGRDLISTTPSSPTGTFIPYNQAKTIQSDAVVAKFDANTFYSSFYLDQEETASPKRYYSPYVRLHESNIPVHNAYSLKIKAEGLPSELESKALIVAIDPKSHKEYAMGGQYANGWVETSCRQLGTFAITTDEKAPVITPLNIKNHSSLTNCNKVSFKIIDDLSGIDSYYGELDGQWVLFEYDAKNNLLEYSFDEKRLQLGKTHQLKLTVKDGSGNASTYEASFYR